MIDDVGSIGQPLERAGFEQIHARWSRCPSPRSCSRTAGLENRATPMMRFVRRPRRGARALAPGSVPSCRRRPGSADRRPARPSHPYRHGSARERMSSSCSSSRITACIRSCAGNRAGAARPPPSRRLSAGAPSITPSTPRPCSLCATTTSTGFAVAQKMEHTSGTSLIRLSTLMG